MFKSDIFYIISVNTFPFVYSLVMLLSIMLLWFRLYEILFYIVTWKLWFTNIQNRWIHLVVYSLKAFQISIIYQLETFLTFITNSDILALLKAISVIPQTYILQCHIIYWSAQPILNLRKNQPPYPHLHTVT